MNKIRIRKLLTLLLSFVMVVCLIPAMGVPASAETLISAVSAKVTPPVVGLTPGSCIVVLSGDSSKYTVTIENWKKDGSTSDRVTGDRIYDDTPFESSHLYCVDVVFTPKEGYTFSSDIKTNAIINGSSASFITMSAKTGQYLFRIGFEVGFLTLEDNSAYNIPTGTEGTTYTTTKPLTATGGKAPYEFTITPSIPGLSINSSGYIVFKRTVVDSAKTVTVTVTDSENSTESIEIGIGEVTSKSTSKAITDISANPVYPVAGKTPATTARLGDSTKYTLESIEWRKGGNTRPSSTLMNSSETFKSGETYMAFIRFVSQDGFFFEDDEALTVTINGKVATYFSHEEKDGNMIRATYYVSYTLPEAVTSVSATIDAPEEGVMPSFDATVPDGVNYHVESVSWYDEDDNWVDSAFKIGKKYKVGIILKGNDGYALDPNTTGKLNGMDCVIKEFSTGNYALEYTFPAITSDTSISSVSATITEPEAEAKPAQTADTGDSNYNVTVVGWFKGGTAKGPGTKMDPDEGFIAGETYVVELEFIPASGYVISDSAPATINFQISYHSGINATKKAQYYRIAFSVPAVHTHTLSTTWKSDAVNHWHICSACAEILDKAAHSFGAWSETKAATETAEGSRERVCSVCGYKQTEVIAKLSHTHSFTGAWKSDATNHWQLCSCGEKGIASKHSFGAWSETKAATETATGSRERTCSVCGYIESSVLPILGHEHSYSEEWKSDSANHWNECDCGEKSNEAAHTFGEWTTVKEATETEEGSKKRACSVCGYEEYEAILVSGTVAPETDATEPESSTTETPETTEPTPSGSSPFDFSSMLSLFILIATIVLGVVIVAAVITVVIVIIVKAKKR